MLKIVALGLLLGERVLIAGGACTGDVGMFHRDRATTFYEQGDLASAVASLRSAIQACPAEPFYRFMLANALYRAGELREAASNYQSFLDRRPDHLEARMSLGFTLFELGDKKRAVDQWAAAMHIDPESPFARAAYALGLYATGDYDNAIVQYDVAVKLDHRYEDPDALGIDIRWKTAVRTLLGELKRFNESQWR